MYKRTADYISHAIYLSRYLVPCVDQQALEQSTGDSRLPVEPRLDATAVQRSSSLSTAVKQLVQTFSAPCDSYGAMPTSTTCRRLITGNCSTTHVGLLLASRVFTWTPQQSAETQPVEQSEFAINIDTPRLSYC